MTTETETTNFTSFNTGLFERMQDMHRSWLERLREMRQIESDFGTRLLTAKSPSEATTICNEWMAKRLKTVANEQQTFGTAWIGLISDVLRVRDAAAGLGPLTQARTS